MQITESITLQMDDHMNTRWKAACQLCRWKQTVDTRAEAERLLHNHLGTHNTEQGAMF